MNATPSIRVGIPANLAAILLAWGALGSVAGSDGPPRQTPPRSGEDLFQATKVWSLHLRFTPEHWAKIEPPAKQGGPPGGMPPGPGLFLAPAFLKAGDIDADGTLDAAEFRGLGARWATDWDPARTGKLGQKEVRDGLNSALGVPTNASASPPKMNLQGPPGKRNGLSSMIGLEFNYVHADMEFEGQTFRDVAVRYKGNGTYMETRGGLKRSLKIDLNKHVKGQKLAGLATLNLHNNVTDASAMNEALAYRLYRDAGVPAPRVGYARVFVTVAGTHDRRYFGLYSLVENVDKDFVRDRFQARDGALFKPVSPDLFADLGERWADYRQTYDPKTDLTAAQEGRLISFCKLIAGATDADLAAQVGGFVDLDHLARYLAITTWLADLDGILGPGQNFYLLFLRTTGRFVFVPWDQDHSFGQFAMRGTQTEREQLSIQHPWEGKNRFLERVYQIPAFQERYLAHLREFDAGVFRPDRFSAQLTEVAAAIRPAIAEEGGDKLTRFDRAVAGESPALDPATPFGFSGVSVPVRAFAPRRSESVAAQVAGQSVGLTLGSTKTPGPPPGDFTPGTFLAGLFLREIDRDRDGSIARAEFIDGFATWFTAWDADHTGRLTSAQLSAGIDRDLAFNRGGLPPGREARKEAPKP